MSTLADYQTRADAEIERDTRKLLARSYECPAIERREWRSDQIGMLARYSARLHSEREIVRLRSAQVVAKIARRDDERSVALLSRALDNLWRADLRYTHLTRQARLVRRVMESMEMVAAGGAS